MPTAAQINVMLDEAAEVVDEQGLSLAVAPYSWLGGPTQPMQSATPLPLMVQGGLRAPGVLAAADPVTTVAPSRANGARKDPRIAQPIQVIADDRANEVDKIWAITDMRVPQFGDVVEPKDIVVGTVVGTDYRQALCLIDGMHMLVDEFLAATLSGALRQQVDIEFVGANIRRFGGGSATPRAYDTVSRIEGLSVSPEVVETRVLHIAFAGSGKRNLDWKDVDESIKEEAASDWPIDGPRTVAWRSTFFPKTPLPLGAPPGVEDSLWPKPRAMGGSGASAVVQFA